MTRDGERIRELESAARLALDALEDMTTDEFERGADGDLRTRLARALDFPNAQSYYDDRATRL